MIELMNNHMSSEVTIPPSLLRHRRRHRCHHRRHHPARPVHLPLPGGPQHPRFPRPQDTLLHRVLQLISAIWLAQIS
ncbi:hypothetical protein, conserved [Babesia bigemina]|uniref:Uncharacterized protein n=1 Tax=Babesia bigemina TaxID=5866 RepID=A0A061BKH8_BABBI|nr:hypothetical protein, conserved [Babesia bigemina]CDR71975.1 hypothetical protein, conserved [Babesia bigemina]|eukprot:XP_012770916.1 hypothetical protein, conserved [Babesia bigemina]